jgi:hypothetical protein
VRRRCDLARLAAEAAVVGALAQLLAGAVGVVGYVGAVVLVETDGRGGVELGLDGVGNGALGLDDRSGVRDLCGGAEGGDLGGGDAEVEGHLGRVGGGAEDGELLFGVGDGGEGFNAGGAGVGDDAHDVVALEAEDEGVLLGDEELVEGDVDDRGVEGVDAACVDVVGWRTRFVDLARRLATAARDEVEGIDELLVLGGGDCRGVVAKGVLFRDNVGVVEILATELAVDAEEEEGEGEQVLEVQVLVDGEGGAAVFRFGLVCFRHAKAGFGTLR